MSGGQSASQSQALNLKAQWITPRRVQGLRRAVAVAVGEKHSVALQGFWIPKLPDSLDLHVLARKVSTGAEARVSSGDMDGDDAAPSGYEGARPSEDGSENLSALARPPRHPRDCPGYVSPPICCSSSIPCLACFPTAALSETSCFSRQKF